MKAIKLLALLFAALISNPASATDLSVIGAQVSKVITYDTSDGSVNAWIWLNGNSRVGPNPNNSAVTCELWTTNKVIYASALTAMVSAKNVDVNYGDNSNGSYWCKVKTFGIVSE